MDSKIAIITCWMGEYPNYFPLWLKSCEFNPQIDWFLVAEKEPNLKLPKNVIFYKTGLKDFKTKVEKQTNIDAKGLTSPYKLCDFRPLYGIIFEEQLKGYTHWGHCDIDMVFGDIGYFVSDELLNSYDKIFTKGHLCIYKNNKEVNNRCFDKSSIYPFECVAKNHNFYAFDEITGIERIYRKRGYDYYSKTPYIDVSVRYESSYLLNDVCKNFNEQAFYWENGKVYRVYVDDKGKIVTDQWLYLHFQKKKPTNYVADLISTKSFWIGPKGFFEKSTEFAVTREDIQKFNPSISKKQAKKEKRAYFKKKIKELIKKSWKDKCIHVKQRLSRIFL